MACGSLSPSTVTSSTIISLNHVSRGTVVVEEGILGKTYQGERGGREGGGGGNRKIKQQKDEEYGISLNYDCYLTMHDAQNDNLPKTDQQ